MSTKGNGRIHARRSKRWKQRGATRNGEKGGTRHAEGPGVKRAEAEGERAEKPLSQSRGHETDSGPSSSEAKAARENKARNGSASGTQGEANPHLWNALRHN